MVSGFDCGFSAAGLCWTSLAQEVRRRPRSAATGAAQAFFPTSHHPIRHRRGRYNLSKRRGYSFRHTDTAPYPVLALFGELDRNVLPAVNVPLWEQALQRGGHTDYQLVVISRANHGLRLATTGGRNEPRGPVSPDVWPTVYAWLAEHVSLKH